MNGQVALKLIRGSRGTESRQRFLREAEITGRLDHPGVVPVHAIGKDDDERPYYVMKLVDGESLREVIRRFHAADGQGRGAGERRLAFRRLLGQFVAVSKTIAYG